MLVTVFVCFKMDLAAIIFWIVLVEGKVFSLSCNLMFLRNS